MNISQLECFVTLAGTLNYMKTADELGLTQPAVSKQIKALEEELGTTLFYRTTRSVSLTRIGERYLTDANQMLNTYYHSLDWIGNFHAAETQSIRIGYSDPNVMGRVSSLLKLLHKQFPNLTPIFTYDQTDANLGRLQHGQLDVMFSMKDSHFSDDHILFHKLRDERFACIIARSHPFAATLLEEYPDMTSVTTKQLWPCEQVVAIPPYLLKQYFSRGRKIISVNEDLTNIICSNTNEAYGLVLGEFGYAMIPRHMIMPHPDLYFWDWTDSPVADFGLYYRKEAVKDTASIISSFIKSASDIF
ncbi:MAG: LysR family transcriptional regulator [Eubacterium sp.]|nr:LysR family transcriptional regulator [Eubacterium sp.]